MEILIVGATARAAAMSAIRAGLQPITIDLFADRDLQAIAPTIKVAPGDYPHGLVDAALKLSPRPFLYTGGLENHALLVDRIAKHHTLWGNGSAVLGLIRDPIRLATALTTAGFLAPRMCMDPPFGLGPGETWLVKPLASAGGIGIHPWSPIEADLADAYFQQQILGPSGSATYLSRHDGVELIAINWQIVGEPDQRFVYRGNLTPMNCEPETRAELQRLGQFLREWSGLRGLFGVDFVLRDGRPWILEVNPRYTAAMELVEFSTGRSLLAEHGRVFDHKAPASVTRTWGTSQVLGKLVVYARKPSRFPLIKRISPRGLDPFTMPRYADIPQPGELFASGEPVLTLLGQGNNADDCHHALQRRAERWRRRIEREAQSQAS